MSLYEPSLTDDELYEHDTENTNSFLVTYKYNKARCTSLHC